MKVQSFVTTVPMKLRDSVAEDKMTCYFTDKVHGRLDVTAFGIMLTNYQVIVPYAQIKYFHAIDESITTRTESGEIRDMGCVAASVPETAGSVVKSIKKKST